MNVNKYGASWAEITLPVAAAMGTVQVEAHIAGIGDEVRVTSHGNGV